MKIAISAESAIDLSKELLDKYDIHTVSFGINLGDKLIEEDIVRYKDIYGRANK